MITLLKSNPRSAQQVANAMKLSKTVSKTTMSGGVVIIPTDTVYGLSAIADDPIAQDDEGAAAIRAVKGRTETKPFITLIEKPSDIRLYTDDGIPQSLLDLWPGALTIVVNAPSAHRTIALRCPEDEWLRRVIGLCGKPIYSTSCNISGGPVLNNMEDICHCFANSSVSLAVDDGDKIARPSTIVSVADGKVKILRQGDVVISV